MNCLFIVQGEGRGHMTQALSLRSMLENAGHRVVGALVGSSRRRTVPRFFEEGVGTSVTTFASPNFVVDANDRSIRVPRTLAETVRHGRKYRGSLKVLGAHLQRIQPDLVVNFFEPLAGVYYALYRPATPMVSVGHQYLVHHPAFPFPEGHAVSRRALRYFADLTAVGAATRLALSFRPLPDLPDKKIRVVPPLLRDTVIQMPRNGGEPFLLAYVLNSGYADQIIRWHADHPEQEVHCFWDNPEVPSTWSPQPGLTFHALDGPLFLKMMSRCRGLVCTAGFESVCEAMYLDKPVMMVPVEGHFEQQCNALDAVAAGAGITSRQFDIDRFMRYLPHHDPGGSDFRTWVESGAAVFVEEMERAVGRRGRSDRSRRLLRRQKQRLSRRRDIARS